MMDRMVTMAFDWEHKAGAFTAVDSMLDNKVKLITAHNTEGNSTAHNTEGNSTANNTEGNSTAQLGAAGAGVAVGA